MKDIYGRVGRRVREHRLALDMTLEELAEGADLHPSYVGQIERGDKKASLATVFALADALDVPVGELFAEGAARRRVEDEAATRLSALLRRRRDDEKQVLLSTLRHLARELRDLRRRER